MSLSFKKIIKKFFGLWTDSSVLSQQVTRGGFLIIFVRVLIKFIYFIRTLILARLLFPGDFGLFALATLTMSLVETFSQTGFNNALIQIKGDIQRYLQIAWTINFFRNLFLAFVLFFVASPLAVIFFHNPQVVILSQVLSIVLFLMAFENIGIVLLQKNLEFHKKFFYDILVVLFEVLLTIIAAFVLKNVWALIIGVITGRLIAVVLSYVFCPFKPRFLFEWKKVKILFAYGKWISLIGIITFLVTKADSILIGYLLPLDNLGFYQLAMGLGILPATEIVRSLGALLFPFFAKISSDRLFLREMFIKVARIIFAFSIPASLGLGILSYQIILNFYGAKWLPMTQILYVIVILGLVKAFELIANPLFLGIGKPKVASTSLILQALIMLPLMWFLTLKFSAFGDAPSSICFESPKFLLFNSFIV